MYYTQYVQGIINNDGNGGDITMHSEERGQPFTTLPTAVTQDETKSRVQTTTSTRTS